MRLLPTSLPRLPRLRLTALPLLGALALTAIAGCGPDASGSARAPLADKWFNRAQQSYKTGDLEDATQAVESALKAAPQDEETRLLAARIALAKLDYADAVKFTEGLTSPEAKGLRGRAFWYQGDIERAADDLEDMLRDPTVKDNWARDVAKLARRGHGRHPFAMEGAVVASVEMPQAGPALIVPMELEGERVLAMVSTAMGELMIDSTHRKEPAWVNLRFGEKLEVKDVPALTYDLSNISRQLGAPIKALIGINALRHMHVTFDRRGSQFVVRKAEPSAPPDASRVPLVYVRGGGMMMRAAVSNKDDGHGLLFVDSSQFWPLALDDSLIKRSGADLANFHPEPGAPKDWKVGMLPFFKLGTLDLPQVPAMQGGGLAEYKSNFDVDLGGVVGAGLLSAFRVTFGDEGRALWLELDPSLTEPQDQPDPRRQSAPPSPPSEAAPPAAPTKDPSAKPAPKPSAAAPKTESKGAAK